MTVQKNRIVGLVEDSVEITDLGATCQVVFQPNEPVFAGHFPGNPIVPGVLMLEGLVALNARLGATLIGIKEAKFRAIARPSQTLRYSLTREGLGAVTHVDGEVVLSCKLTLGIEPA